MSEANLLHVPPARRPLSPFTIIAVVAVFLLVGGAVAVGAWTNTYDDRMAPNVWIGSVPVGGLTEDAARLLVQKRADELLDRGLRVSLNGADALMPLDALVGDDLVEDAHLDVDAAVETAFAIGHDRNAVRSALALVASLRGRQTVSVPVQLREEALRRSVTALFPDAERPVGEARFAFRRAAAGWTVDVLNGETGRAVDWTSFLRDAEDRLGTLSLETVPLRLRESHPAVDREQAERAKPLALEALAQAPYAFVHGEGAAERTLSIDDRLLANVLLPASDGGLALDPAPITTALSTFARPFETEPHDAVFRMEGQRVVEFVPSRDGKKADTDAALIALASVVERAGELLPEEKRLSLPLITVAPAVSTAQSNELGIAEPLGTGYSSYHGSPVNRVRNIRNGVELLDGLLIAPGATFSAVEALRPFTLDNGYVPELVIKGDKIEPELGGGLCQIGSTMFRMAMNTGLPIAERRNHSLVVSYYNDPANGNPGTDATLYEPAPDFKFVNDTGHHLLFRAEMNESEQALYFTLWGTSDGREGSYTPPVVHRWIPAGPTRNVPSADIPVGSPPKCQNAYQGADASFVYTIVRADGTEEARTFTSHYRALPRICLVPIEEEPAEEEEAAEEENVEPVADMEPAA